MTKSDVAKQLDLALESVGFVRKKFTWYRKADDGFCEVVDLQFSKWAPEFTINAGVSDLRVHTTMFPSTAWEDSGVEGATASSRVGHLSKDLRDVWWKLDDPTALECAIEAVLSTIVPFTEALSSRTSLIRWLRGEPVQGKGGVLFCRSSRIRLLPMQRVSLAVLLALDGDVVEASEILRSYLGAKGGGFSRYAAEVSQRLGLPVL